MTVLAQRLGVSVSTIARWKKRTSVEDASHTPHRLPQPRHPQTNGMVERLNGRIADILCTHHFHCGEELEATILLDAWLYNHHLPQRALGHVSPIQAVKQCQQSHPGLFQKQVVNQAGHDT